MFIKQMDAISSFQHIVDNAPQWRTQLAEIIAHAAAKYEEFVAEYSHLMHQAKTKRKKSASIASLHSSDDENDDSDQQELRQKSPRPSELLQINPLEAGNRFIYAQAHRKRKPGTSLRAGGSGPRTYRSRHSLVIYYDSHIQSELDKLVKGFGAARNNLRKGKNAYVAAKGFALPSLTRRFDNPGHLVAGALVRQDSRLAKTTTGLSADTAAKGPVGEVTFMAMDKELDHIQGLCETAAHQVIRDGDCKIELQEAQAKMDLLVAMAESTLHLLEDEKQQQQDEVEARVENSSMSDTTSTRSTLCEKPSLEAMSKAHSILPPVIESLGSLKRPPLPVTISAPGGPMSMNAIEVDDDDDDDDDDSSIELNINIANLRAGRRVAV